MEVRRLNNELYHHGIEGQKWGVKHGPPYPLGSNISTGNRLKNAIDKAKHKVTNFKISDRTKKILIAAGITAGAIVIGTVAARTWNMYSKTHFNTAIHKVKFQRYQDGTFFDPMDGNSSYMTFGFLDKITYTIHPTFLTNNGSKDLHKLILQSDTINVPSFKKANEIFSNAFKDPSIKNEIGIGLSANFELYKSRKMTPANARRLRLFKKALYAYDNNMTDSKSMSYIYDAWNTVITNNNDVGGWSSTNKIFDAFKKEGYQAIWDNHDIYISGYKAKNPMIVIDKSSFTVESARRLKGSEIKLAKLYRKPLLVYNAYIDSISNLLYNPSVASIRF